MEQPPENGRAPGDFGPVVGFGIGLVFGEIMLADVQYRDAPESYRRIVRAGARVRNVMLAVAFFAGLLDWLGVIQLFDESH